MTRLLHDYAREAAQARPEAIAVVLGKERLTYGALERRSDDLAGLLADRGARPGDRVALGLPKSPAATVAMLATLKAGCAYVPLDTDSPPARVARMVRSADPVAVLATPPATGFLDALSTHAELPPVIGATDEHLAGEQVVSVATAADAEQLAAAPPERRGRGGDLAHLLFTSGSTGEPKGVMITHANAVAFVDWGVRHFGIEPDERTSGQTPLHFDLSTFDVYGTFAAGAQLHMMPVEASVDPRALARAIRESELTQWFSVPSILTYMARFDAIEQGDFPELRRLLWCGEVLPTPTLIHWMQRLPHVRFTNLYGPTEATIASSHHTVAEPPADPIAEIPIGVACEGEQLLVLDETLQPAPTGEVGHLHIGGVGLSPGYWRDPQRTAEVFLDNADPASPGRIYRTGDLARWGDDGLLYFLGRTDSQIKSRGFRIELGEIEVALNAIDGIGECAVVGVEIGGFEGTQICAAYSGAGGGPEPPEVRKRLAESLPRYMLPSRLEQVESLPKNANGKIDRPALRERVAGTSRRPPS